MSTCLYIGSVFSLNSFGLIFMQSNSVPPPMYSLSNYPKVCIRGLKLRCLQVPGWRAKSCWLDFSSCCCCCWWWCPRQCSRCCHQTSSVFVACLELVLLAQLQGQRNVGYSYERKSIINTTKKAEVSLGPLPGGATILCHF